MRRLLTRRLPSSSPALSHLHVGHRHAVTPCRHSIRLDTEGSTVFAQPDKFEHQFHVFYNFRHQTDRARQVEAPLAYLTLFFQQFDSRKHMQNQVLKEHGFRRHALSDEQCYMHGRFTGLD